MENVVKFRAAKLINNKNCIYISEKMSLYTNRYVTTNFRFKFYKTGCLFDN